MNNRSQQKILRGGRAAEDRETVSWGYLFLTIVCATLMALGFFLVAMQHFVTMDLGFKNSALRKEVQELEAEKRRLVLARELALSPSEVRRTAAKLGFRQVESVIAVSAPETATPAAGDIARGTSPNRTAPANAGEVTRTGSSRPVTTGIPTPAAKPVDGSRPRIVDTKGSGDSPSAKPVAAVARLR